MSKSKCPRCKKDVPTKDYDLVYNLCKDCGGFSIPNDVTKSNHSDKDLEGYPFNMAKQSRYSQKSQPHEWLNFFNEYFKRYKWDELSTTAMTAYHLFYMILLDDYTEKRDREQMEKEYGKEKDNG
tara:strand:- start:475 stop:849 length:375 start_codon:yes stop_codon:yes gene_type:complete